MDSLAKEEKDPPSLSNTLLHLPLLLSAVQSANPHETLQPILTTSNRHIKHIYVCLYSLIKVHF